MLRPRLALCLLALVCAPSGAQIAYVRGGGLL